MALAPNRDVPEAREEPIQGPGVQFARLLAREGKLDALLSILRAEAEFTERRILLKLREGFVTDQAVQAEILGLQGRLSAYAALIAKFKGWGLQPKGA